MFAILLTSALALGTGLLASATYTDGAMLACRTAGQLIGWLLLASPLLALGRLQRRFAEMTAAAIAFTTGAAILYVAYFEWGSTPSFPEANAAQMVPVSMPAALTIEQTVVPLPVPAPAPATPAAQAVLATESHTIPYSPPY